MKLTTTIIAAFCAALFFFSCSKDDKHIPQTDNSNVYAAGYQSNTAGLQQAIYWKNGNAIILGDGFNNSVANAIAVVDSDVYVVGTETVFLSQQIATLWKNGKKSRLSTDTLFSFSAATSITVQGKDVYITGEVLDKGTNKKKVVYWKNGVQTDVSDGTTDEFANSIAVSGADVYIVGNGTIAGNAGSIVGPKYWKNGVASQLATQTGNASSISISGNDVYIAGDEITDTLVELKYWKNGIAFHLATGVTPNLNTSISVSDNKVYLTGAGLNYFVNGSLVPLGLPTDSGLLNKIITAADQSIFVGGTLNGKCALWRNNVELLNSPLDGTVMDVVLAK